MLNNINNYTLYIHTFPNNKVYIGITCQDVLVRWRTNGSGYKNNSLMWRAIQKYGWDNIKHEIIYSNLSLEEANRLEIEFIAQYNSTDPNLGYNILPGGLISSGWHHTETTKQKLSAKNKGKVNNIIPWNKGKYYGHIEVYQYDLAGNFLNKFKSYHEASTTLKIPEGGIRDCVRGNGKTYYGYTFSNRLLSQEEVLDKIESFQGAHRVTIYQYDNEGALVNTFVSYKAVMDALGIAETNLEACLNNRQKTCYNYVFSKNKLSIEEVKLHYVVKSRKYKYKFTIIDKSTGKSAVYYNITEPAKLLNVSEAVLRNIFNGARAKLRNNYEFIKELNNES